MSRTRPAAVVSFCVLLHCLTGCQSGPDVQVEHRAAGFSRDALQGATVAVLPLAVVGGPGSSDLDLAAADAMPGRVIPPAEVLAAARAGGAEQDLAAAAVDAFRATRQVDAAALARLTGAAAWPEAPGPPEYYALVRLQDLQAQVNPSLAPSLRRPNEQSAKGVYSTGATVRLAVVRADDGETVFVGVTSLQREASTLGGPSPTGALPTHPFGGYQDEGHRRSFGGATLPAVARDALEEIVKRMR